MIRPTMMLSVFEYLYLEPGLNSSFGQAKVGNTRGGGGLKGEAVTACWNFLDWLKSGMPLVCCSSSRSVTSDQARGSDGSRLPTVSDSDSVPSETSARAVAPLYALATLASRIQSPSRNGAPVATLAVPARCS